MKKQRFFSSQDIASVTGGSVDNKRLQNWSARDLWVTGMLEPSPGKPKQYTFANLCEAVLANHLRSFGFSDSASREAIKNRVRFRAGKTQNGWENWSAFDRLPEIEGKPGYWLIRLQSSDGDKFGPYPGVVQFFKSSSELAKHLENATAIVVDVASVLHPAFKLAAEEPHAE